MIIEVHALIKNKTKAVAVEMGDAWESASVNFLKTLVAQKLGIDPKYTQKLAVNGRFIEDDSLELGLVFSKQKDIAKKFGVLLFDRQAFNLEAQKSVSPHSYVMVDRSQDGSTSSPWSMVEAAEATLTRSSSPFFDLEEEARLAAEAITEAVTAAETVRTTDPVVTMSYGRI